MSEHEASNEFWTIKRIDTWTASDPLVVLTPSATNPIQVAVSTPATNTNTTFNLTVSTQTVNQIS
jgi:hypothetical protein